MRAGNWAWVSLVVLAGCFGSGERSAGASVKGLESEYPARPDGKYDDASTSITQHGRIGIGETVVAVIAEATPFHAWDLEITADESMVIEAGLAGDVDTVLYVFDETGTVVGRNDDCDVRVGSCLSLMLRPGLYSLLVKGYDARALGSFELRTRRADTMPTDDAGMPVDGGTPIDGGEIIDGGPSACAAEFGEFSVGGCGYGDIGRARDTEYSYASNEWTLQVDVLSHVRAVATGIPTSDTFFYDIDILRGGRSISYDIGRHTQCASIGSTCRETDLLPGVYTVRVSREHDFEDSSDGAPEHIPFTISVSAVEGALVCAPPGGSVSVASCGRGDLGRYATREEFSDEPSWAFHVPALARYRIYAIESNPELELAVSVTRDRMDGATQVVASEYLTPCDSGETACVETDFEPGDYHIHVQGPSWPPDLGRFELYAEISEAIDDPMPVYTLGDRVSATLRDYPRADYWQLDIPEDGVLTLDVVRTDSLPPDEDGDHSLRANVVRVVDDEYIVGDYGEVVNVRMRVTHGRYQIVVNGTSGGIGGTYTLQATLAPYDCSLHAPIHVGDLTTAPPLAPWMAECYVLEVTTPGEVAFRKIGDSTSLDILAVDAAGAEANLVSYNYYFTERPEHYAEVTPTLAAGTYHLVLTNYDRLESGLTAEYAFESIAGSTFPFTCMAASDCWPGRFCNAGTCGDEPTTCTDASVCATPSGCVSSGSVSMCGACTSNADCRGSRAGEFCRGDSSTGYCVGCLTNADCGATEYCDTHAYNGGQCTPADCRMLGCPAGQYCDTCTGYGTRCWTESPCS